jgi:hypothetical protein
MTRCTEPERWTTVPGADAAEEEVASYLAHVGVCPFHAAVEQREEARMRGIAAFARLDLNARDAEARADAAGGLDRLDAEAESLHRASGRGLPVATSAKRRARALSAARRAPRPSDEPAPALRRLPAWRLAAVLCALTAVVLLAILLFLPNEQPTPFARQEQPGRTAEAHTPSPPTPEATPFNTHTQDRHDVVPGHTPTPPAPPRVSQGDGWVSPPQRTRERMTVADVRRVYVSAGEGTYDRQLREALIERLRDSDRFIVVTGEQQADAVLLREQPRSAGMSVQLVTRGGKTLWFMTQPAGVGGVEDVGDLAARIIAALTAAADKRQPPTNAPPR